MCLLIYWQIVFSMLSCSNDITLTKIKKIQMVVATDTSELIHSYNFCQWQRIEGMNKLYQRLLHLVSKQNFQLSINKLHTYWYELRLSFFLISAYIERVAINVQSFIFTRAIFVDYDFFAYSRGCYFSFSKKLILNLKICFRPGCKIVR